MSGLVQCPIGIDVGEPHTYSAGTGHLAFMDIMGVAGHIREVCADCAHPSNEPIVDGGLELAPDMTIYTVWVGDTRLNIKPISARDAINLAQLYSDYDEVVITISPYSSQYSYTWSEMSELTHRVQVEIFGFCSCEDNVGNENPYADCPVTSMID